MSPTLILFHPAKVHAKATDDKEEGSIHGDLIKEQVLLRHSSDPNFGQTLQKLVCAS